MAERSASPSELVPEAMHEQPLRPDVTLALLHAQGLELTVSRADETCDFEILNISSDPSAAWDAAVKIAPSLGDNWQPAGTGGKLVLGLDALTRLAVRANHAMLIRQVKRDGVCSVQSLFRVVVIQQTR